MFKKLREAFPCLKKPHKSGPEYDFKKSEMLKMCAYSATVKVDNQMTSYEKERRKNKKWIRYIPREVVNNPKKIKEKFTTRRAFLIRQQMEIITSSGSSSSDSEGSEGGGEQERNSRQQEGDQQERVESDKSASAGEGSLQEKVERKEEEEEEKEGEEEEQEGKASELDELEKSLSAMRLEEKWLGGKVEEVLKLGRVCGECGQDMSKWRSLERARHGLLCGQ